MAIPQSGPRSSYRLRGYDYSEAGAYFVTICCRRHEPFLGNIDGGHVQLFAAGMAAESFWIDLPKRYPHVRLDAWVVMPNHMHGILFFEDYDIACPHRSPGKRAELGAVIRSFKAATTRTSRASGVARFAWQPNFYDHIIRSETDLRRIREYIENNPMKWELDQFHPDRKMRSRPENSAFGQNMLTYDEPRDLQAHAIQPARDNSDVQRERKL